MGQIFGVLSRSMPVARMLLVCLAVAAISLSAPLLTTDPTVCFVAFLLFEGSVGIYWPAQGTLKSKIVPEDARSTIYSIFRLPLNAIVLGVLLTDVSTTTAFACCAVMLTAATYACMLLIKMGIPETGRNDEEDAIPFVGDRDGGVEETKGQG